jgi:hypothetical protein
VVLYRDSAQGWVEVIDEVTFVSGPGTYESVLTTFGDVQMGDGSVIIQAEKAKLRVTYDATTVRARLDVVANVPLTSGVQDVNRVVFEWPQAQQSGTVRLEISPVS